MIAYASNDTTSREIGSCLIVFGVDRCVHVRSKRNVTRSRMHGNQQLIITHNDIHPICIVSSTLIFFLESIGCCLESGADAAFSYRMLPSKPNAVSEHMVLHYFRGLLVQGRVMEISDRCISWDKWPKREWRERWQLRVGGQALVKLFAALPISLAPPGPRHIASLSTISCSTRLSRRLDG